MAQGLITLTNGSAAVSGAGTHFGTDNKIGDFIVGYINGQSYSLAIASIESPTALTLTEVFYGPTTASVPWDSVPLRAITAIPYQLGVQQLKALRLMNLESDNWLQMYTTDGNMTANLPDGRQYTGPSLKYIADNAATKIKGAVPVAQGGTGAVNTSDARTNLGVGDNNVVTHGGLRLDVVASAAENGGIFESRRLTDDKTSVVSQARIYSEVQAGVSKITFHVGHGPSVNRYFQLDQNGGLSGIDNLTIGKQILFPPLTDVARLAFDGIIGGGSGAMATAQVEGTSWGNWRSTGAGLIIQNPSLGAASTVWKSVQWGRDWSSCMSTVVAADNNHACALIVGGFQSTFYANGTAQGNWVSASDLRLKTRLKRIEAPIEKLASLVGYTYFKRGNMVEDDRSYYSEEAGLIAQDVNEVLPECVYEYGAEKMLGVNYNGVVALLVNAFNELADTVKRQGARIEELEALLAKK